MQNDRTSQAVILFNKRQQKYRFLSDILIMKFVSGGAAGYCPPVQNDYHILSTNIVIFS